MAAAGSPASRGTRVSRQAARYLIMGPSTRAPTSNTVHLSARGHKQRVPMIAYAQAVAGRLADVGVRSAVVDGGPLDGRIREAHRLRIPLVAIAGAREMAAEEIALRRQGGGRQAVESLQDPAAILGDEVADAAVTGGRSIRRRRRPGEPVRCRTRRDELCPLASPRVEKRRSRRIVEGSHRSELGFVPASRPAL